jgi:hypothetical protein
MGTLGTTLLNGTLIVIIGVPVLLLGLLAEQRIRHYLFWRKLDKEQEIARQHFTSALHKPDWAYYRKHLGREVPDILQQAYADSEFIGKPHAFRGQTLSFLPIGQPTQTADTWFQDRYLSVAELGEDPVFLRPGGAKDNAVYGLPDSEDADDLFEEISPSLEQFLSELGFAAPRHALNCRK